VTITVAAGTQYAISTGTHGAVLGDDSFTIPSGTLKINTSSTSMTINSGSVSWSSQFGRRQISGTWTFSSPTLSGTGGQALTEVAVNDVVGLTTGASTVFARVVSIAGNNSFNVTTNVTLTNPAGGNLYCCEQPTILATGDSQARFVDGWADNGTLTLSSSASTLTGVTVTIGRVVAGAAPSAAQYGFVHVVQGGTGTSAIISTQRTRTYANAFGGSSGISGYSTSYRRIGSLVFDSSGNVLNFQQSGNGAMREYYFRIAVGGSNPNVFVNAGGALSFTSFACGGLVPPTADMVYLSISSQAPSAAVVVELLPRMGSYPASSAILAAWTASGAEGGCMAWTPCDGAQYCAYFQNNPGGNTVFIYGAGYRESL
jgi:hypothetical protein